MDVAAFTRKYPKLYHLSFATNLQSIQEHGLQCVAALADTYSFSTEERKAVLDQRRICIQDLHGISIRDQRPAPESKMKSCLVNISIPEWFEILNSKIFFFVSLEKTQRLLSAYTDYDNLLLEIDTATLLDQYAAHASVCRINSGSFLYKPVPRGRNSFIPLQQYEPRRKNDTPAELTLDCAVPNIMQFAKSIALP